MTTKRDVALAKARVAGYHDDARTFTRLRIESRVAIEHLNKEWQRGVTLRKGGASCSCFECQRKAVEDRAEQERAHVISEFNAGRAP